MHGEDGVHVVTEGVNCCTMHGRAVEGRKKVVEVACSCRRRNVAPAAVLARVVPGKFMDASAGSKA